eukprot:TRINITY_DN87913_c0_g1_i1.p1 TRINITY_DN87913_c0_g1~~TRINITY_DN87913_c0_g1_i1.p1  ORF type:complete len:1286 (-),score=231.43 TRINITY_DN87913_c0_g1_i1:113-3970(-)
MWPYVHHLLALLLHLELIVAFSPISQNLVAVEVDAFADSNQDEEGVGFNRRQERTKMIRSEEKQSDKVQRLRPAPFDTTGPTCDGTALSECGAGDPCTVLGVDACLGAYHACGGGSFRRCEKDNKNASCITGGTCYLPCAGVFVEESKTGAPNPDCTDLTAESCQNSYIKSASSTDPFMGYQCRLEDIKKCIRDQPCAVQDPAVSLGEKLCSAPSVEFTPVGHACKDATKFRPNQTCLTQCDGGYKPSVDKLVCQADGLLSPEKFVCVPQPCQAPAAIPNDALAGPCAEGSSIKSGEVCTARCKENYIASESELRCTATRLFPSTFKCLAPCTPPTVQFAPGDGTSCDGGGPVKHGASCKAMCNQGFKASVDTLLCQDGTLVASEGSTQSASFTCSNTFCAAPDVEKGIGCEETQGGKVLAKGEQCTAKCKDNYIPSKAKIQCDPSALQGPDFKLPADSFKCLAPCIVPQVQNAKNGGACDPGTVLLHGSQCSSLLCENGYKSAGGPLSCNEGVLTGTMSCVAADCAPPEVPNGLGCDGKASVKKGETCTAKCAVNFVPSVQEVTCEPAKLVAPAYKMPTDSFKCHAPCTIPAVENAQGGSACSPGSILQHGANCQTQCNPGYKGEGGSFSCSDGALAGSFSCRPNECRPPDVQFGAGCKDTTLLTRGQKCVAQCVDNYVPSVGEVTCDPDKLTAPEFKMPVNSWTCHPPCTIPTADNAVTQGDCSPGSKLKHGQDCKPQCLTGFQNNGGQMTCNSGTLNPNSFSCELIIPAEGQSFYNCWHGDPHFTCKDGKRTDPLIQGNHWILQQECPGQPNWMWVQGLFGPYSPSLTMGTAFGGAFLLGNVVTFRVVEDNSEKWEVKFNNQKIQNVWTKVGDKYKFTLAPGMEMDVWFSSRKVTFNGPYGLKYEGSRYSQTRHNTNAAQTENLPFQNRYSNNNIWAKICQNANVNGQAWDLHNGYNPNADKSNFVPDAVSLWKKSTKEAIASELAKTTAAGQNNHATWQSLLSLDNGTATFTELGEAQQADPDHVMTTCVGQALQIAHDNCDAAAHEGAIDEEDKANHLTALRTCLFDACAIQEGGDQPEDLREAMLDEEALNDNVHHLLHKESFTQVEGGANCPEDKAVKVDAAFRAKLTSDEDASLPACSKVAEHGNPCDACARIGSDSRMYMVGNLKPRLPVSALCEEHRLAMPKEAAQREALHKVQTRISVTDKAWLGGRFQNGKWVWEDGSDVGTGAPAQGKNGNWLCMELSSGNMIRCCESEDGGDCQTTAEMPYDALCETQFKS